MFCRVHRCFGNMMLFIVCSVTPVCLLQELQSYRKKRSTATPAAVTCREIAPGLTKWSGGDRCHSGGFLLRIMPPSWQPVPACTRNSHSAGGQFINAATNAAGGPFNTATRIFRRRNCNTLRRRKLESDEAPLRQRPRQAGRSILRQQYSAGGTAILCGEEK